MALFKKNDKEEKAPVTVAPVSLSTEGSHPEFVKEKERIEKEISTNPFRQKGETVAEYNERIPIGIQPVQPGPTHSYLGKKL